MKVLITVEETFDNDHRVVSKRDSHSGRFHFSAADAGQHRICFTPETDATSGFMSSSLGAVKVSVDIAIGETSKIETEDKDKMKDIVQRVKDLNSRLHDIRREQVYQRVSNPQIYSLTRYPIAGLRNQIIQACANATDLGT
jgi:hypothetical protein